MYRRYAYRRWLIETEVATIPRIRPMVDCRPGEKCRRLSDGNKNARHYSNQMQGIIVAFADERSQTTRLG